MQPAPDRLEQLFQKYFHKTASPAERAELAELMDDPANKEAFMQMLTASWDSYEGDGNVLPAATTQAMLERITGSDAHTVPSIAPARKRNRWWPAAAAIVLLAVAGSVWMMTQKTGPSQQPPAIAAAPADVQPGSNGAILILNNGQRIVLDSAHTGLLAQQGNATVTRQDNALVYKGEGAGVDAGYNTIATPRGRQYPNLVLQDGTKVWLDAGSSLRFPVVFSGKERIVEMTGQAWFEVAHNARQPFKVMARGIEINDIGTQFNVNAYPDEPEIKTTLVEGSIRVEVQRAHDARLTSPVSRLLTPGQQAVLTNEQLRVSSADIPQTLAWKNGIFFFKNADIKTVMKELTRWYDITVEYEGADYTETFSGKIARGLTLRELLDGLAQTRVRYRIETGNRLVILPPSK